jgi:hypothetical protein
LTVPGAPQHYHHPHLQLQQQQQQHQNEQEWLRTINLYQQQKAQQDRERILQQQQQQQEKQMATSLLQAALRQQPMAPVQQHQYHNNNNNNPMPGQGPRSASEVADLARLNQMASAVQIPPMTHAPAFNPNYNINPHLPAAMLLNQHRKNVNHQTTNSARLPIQPNKQQQNSRGNNPAQFLPTPQPMLLPTTTSTPNPPAGPAQRPAQNSAQRPAQKPQRPPQQPNPNAPK